MEQERRNAAGTGAAGWGRAMDFRMLSTVTKVFGLRRRRGRVRFMVKDTVRSLKGAWRPCKSVVQG
ncbi:hypothetical protein GCM10023080_033590 [Streptomyces pseudoechinosporeus]